MAPSRESSCHLHDEPVSPLQLVMHVMYDEEEAPNVKRMRVVEEEVSLSQPQTDAVPLEEEEVPAPQGPVVVVPPEEEVPPEEVEVPATPCRGPIVGPHCRGPVRGRGGHSPPCHGPIGRKGMPYPCTVLSKFFALLFSQKCRRFFSSFFHINVLDL
jgi:hypothetical protein